MTLTFLARGSVQMNEMPRGAALELYTLQACRQSIKAMNAPHFGRHGGEQRGGRRPYFHIHTLYADRRVEWQTTADAVLEEVCDLRCFSLQNILDAENKLQTKTQSAKAPLLSLTGWSQVENKKICFPTLRRVFSAVRIFSATWVSTDVRRASSCSSFLSARPQQCCSAAWILLSQLW